MKKPLRYGLFPEEEYYDYKNAKVVIVPIPYDETSTWMKGADNGPDALLEASQYMEIYDIETDSSVYKHGIFTDTPITEKSSPEKMIDASKKVITNHLNNNKFVVTIGGEHSVTNGPVQAYSQKFKDLTVLQLDAHTDLRKNFHGEKFSHASIMSRVKELCPIVQVGIRSSSDEEKQYIEKDRIFYAQDIHDNDKWMEKAISKIKGDLYITIDLDVFDPSVIPSTGTPEPGGLGYYQVLRFLKKAIKEKNLVGFDIVELMPNKDEKSSNFLASKLIYSILSYKFEK